MLHDTSGSQIDACGLCGVGRGLVWRLLTPRVEVSPGFRRPSDASHQVRLFAESLSSTHLHGVSPAPSDGPRRLSARSRSAYRASGHFRCRISPVDDLGSAQPRGVAFVTAISVHLAQAGRPSEGERHRVRPLRISTRRTVVGLAALFSVISARVWDRRDQQNRAGRGRRSPLLGVGLLCTLLASCAGHTNPSGGTKAKTIPYVANPDSLVNVFAGTGTGAVNPGSISEFPAADVPLG